MNNNFYSIDRLVEFGMSIAIAQQMVKSMNDVMSNMRIPGAGNNMMPHIDQPQNQLFYVMIDGKQGGPFSETEIMRLITEKKVVKETYIWMPGMTKWDIAENIPPVIRLAALMPPKFEIK